MSRLVPQKRMDKNGRLVTRHVKDASGAESSKMPAPSIAGQHKKGNVSPVDKLSDLIAKTMGFDTDGWDGFVDMEEIKQTLESYSPKLVDRIIAAWKPRSQLATAIGNMVYQEEPESFLREFSTFGGMVADDDTTGMRETVSYVRALHHYPQLPQLDDYSKADEQTMKACRAIIRATQELRDADGFAVPPVAVHAHNYDSEGTPIITGSLAELLVERPDEVERIVEVVLERRTIDAGAVVAAMDHGVQSLSSGAL